MKKTLLLLLLFILSAAGWFFYTSHKGIGEKPEYIGKASCQGCHPIHFASHNTTLHPIIFRPVTSPEIIVGDFEQNNPLVTFKKEEIEYVVGSKWEQVYMRMIDGEYYPFTAKWMITAQKWVPYKVHDWEKTPASTKCNGCHTTGFNEKSYAFNEFGVNCESCHGPASEHVRHQQMKRETSCILCHDKERASEDDIIVSAKTSVCGQCHSRGTTSSVDANGTKTLFNFPLAYVPGDDISTSFNPSTLQNDTKKKNWWGNGISKNRHQEFADFSFSKHSKALSDLRNKKNPHGEGEADDSCLKCHSQDYRSAKEGEKPTLENAKLGLTCITCHEPHGIDRQSRSDTTGPYKCALCHVNSFATGRTKTADSHFPCPSDKVGCADCHMPYIVKTGGAYTIRSHAFKIIPPKASKEYDMPNSCQNGGCHQERSTEWAIREFDKAYPEFNKKTLADTLKSEAR